MVTRLEAFKSPRFIGKPILADVEFFDSLEKIDQFAADTDKKIFSMVWFCCQTPQNVP